MKKILLTSTLSAVLTALIIGITLALKDGGDSFLYGFFMTLFYTIIPYIILTLLFHGILIRYFDSTGVFRKFIIGTGLCIILGLVVTFIGSLINHEGVSLLSSWGEKIRKEFIAFMLPGGILAIVYHFIGNGSARG
jgi:hypothetical protein